MPIRITGMNSGLDTESIITQLVSAQSTKKDNMTKAQTKLQWKQDAWKELNSKVYKMYTGTISNMRFSSSYVKKKATASDNSIADVTADGEAVDGVQSLKVKQLAKSGYLTGAKLSDSTTGITKMGDLMGLGEGETAEIKVGDESISISSDMRVVDVVAKLKEKGVNANFDEANKRLFISAKGSGENNDFKITAGDDNGIKALASLGLLTEDADSDATVDSEGNAVASDAFKARLEALGVSLSTGSGPGSATRIKGQNAKIELNGAEFESASNNFNVNGLNVVAKKVSDQEVSVTTADDYEGVYDTIKNFLKQYNELINEFDKLYNADSAKGYEPLTDDEKYAMSDKQVEDWEKKIKDSLFRKDETLGSLRDALVNEMSSSITIGDKELSLADFGIGTLGYFNAAENERHALHIDGDKDDSNTSMNADKLQAAIKNNPEEMMKFFQEISNKLYTTITEKTKGDEYRTTYKIYNDKQMAEEYKSYTSKIAEEEKKLTALEDKWYKKFGAMETALAKLSSKTSALSGLLGM
ncbi:MAG: flagellar filament capping protein FliD [Lachnospiraceae bacterium]|nr:flagellar filament capping protein FliD [Lachnospiraceae bacterium]